MSNVTIWGMIDAQPIRFPLVVEEFNAAFLRFPVPVDAARATLPGHAYELVETRPGWAQLIVAALDNRRNPWGDYNEVDLGLLVRPAGAPLGAGGALVYSTLVNQRFSFEAGHRAMTFPRTVDDIRVAYTPEAVVFDAVVDGQPALCLELPRMAPAGAPASIEALAYSYVGDVPYRTVIDIDMPADVVDPAVAGVEVRTGPLADALRRLGLPRSPEAFAWGEGLSARFQLPQVLPGAG